MDGGTPRTNSFSGIKKTASTVGTELCGSLVLLSLGLLSLGRPGTQQVWLLGKPMLRLMLLSPLLHLRHLMLLSLGLLSLGRRGMQQLWLLGKPMLRLMLLSPLLHLRHLVLLSLGQCRRVVFSLLRLCHLGRTGTTRTSSG